MHNTISDQSTNFIFIYCMCASFAGRLDILKKNAPSFSLIEQVSNIKESKSIASVDQEG